ncbi:ogr/Delta-like zinc finger family protein [Moritella viscosa]|uniref:ogr/Delta-like zinc finger family protein n=1 Tax=Moritella viscosa TaxID=80854 RepID=UPI00094C69EE
MRIYCPSCGSVARIATSRTVTEKLREMNCQCKSLNCSATFVYHSSFSHFIAEPRLKSSAQSNHA